MKIITPSEMESGTSRLEEAVDKFNEQFIKEDKDEDYYFLAIDGEYNREVCDEIQKIYTDAGWKKVRCIRSSENGERGGLTGLHLWRR